MKYTYHTIRKNTSISFIIRSTVSMLKGNYFSVVAALLLFTLLLSVPKIIAGSIIDLADADPESHMPLFVIAAIISGISTIMVSAYESIGTPYWILNWLAGNQTTCIAALKKGLSEFPRYIIAIVVAGLIIFLKTLLLVIPGIMAALDYAMMPYIIADSPEIGPCEALKRSRAIMHGHRWQLVVMNLFFCIPLTVVAGALIFILLFCSHGTYLLVPILGIAAIIIVLAIVPVMLTAFGVFYRSILPEADSPEAEELPAISGTGAFSSELKVILLIIIALLYIYSEYNSSVKDSAREKQDQPTVVGTRPATTSATP